ncbi:TetR/AcrR family transcriptional regulator C-terminal domain-containing protein [Mycobacterium talmoniae]|uniref:TetR/AcrR family transcriptional regulator C-terminal domain-containing protein n=1 Tax=Mycobacterium talmoniae TaxID=1858794 RepID=UPI000D53CB86|nr:TetR/AcrR family transcriptional regulator C-terminal domain-containing protein [Mycobacterium talmoniae]
MVAAVATMKYPAVWIARAHDATTWREYVDVEPAAVGIPGESHPRLVDIMSVQPIDAAAVLAALELCASALRRGGLGDDEAVSGLAVLKAYATGYVQRRAERRRNAAVQEERLPSGISMRWSSPPWHRWVTRSPRWTS